MEERLALTVTLNQLADLDQYNHWIYERIEPALGRSVLEVGSGTGNITQFLRTGGRQVMATDVVPSYRRHLRKLFHGDSQVEVGQFDLNHPAPEELVRHGFDTVVCLNVLEHIEDDLTALCEMRRVLRPGGRLALLVPAHQILFGEFDRAVGHFRRYEKGQLKRLLEEAGFIVTRIDFFNLLATLPWLINGRWLKRDYLPAGQTSLANRLVPLLKWERVLGPPFGLSLIALAQKS